MIYYNIIYHIELIIDYNNIIYYKDNKPEPEKTGLK